MSRYVATYRVMLRHSAKCGDTNFVSWNVVSWHTANVVTTWLPEQNVVCSKRGERKRHVATRKRHVATRHDMSQMSRIKIWVSYRHLPLSCNSSNYYNNSTWFCVSSISGYGCYINTFVQHNKFRCDSKRLPFAKWWFNNCANRK